MSIQIQEDSIIYVVAPANDVSGGPELLHQLVFHLRKDLKINSYLYYVPVNEISPTPFEYEQYNVPFINEIEDEEKNLLIVPEIKEYVDILKKYVNIRKCIWWLSIDRFYLSLVISDKKKFFFQRLINKISRIFFGKQFIDIETEIYRKINFKVLECPEWIKNIDFHFVQSCYAFHHLLNKGIPKNKIFYLSDYLNKNFLKIHTNLSQKQNIVAYNPKKGYAFTQQLVKQAKNITFIPIINMDRQQVIMTLQKAKIYIDFGNHPGKDRLPREAAILGCCVITDKKGSAAFYEDVSIPDKYKIEDKEENIPEIIEKINDFFENFEEKYKDFKSYREIILREPQKFLEDLKNIFIN